MLVLLLVNVAVVLVFEIDLVVGDHLIIRQTDLGVDEKLIAMHEEWREIA